MTFIQCAPIIISLLAFGFSLFTYRKHDKKIKDQTKLINDFTLEKLTKEKELEKKAIVEANDERYDKGKRIIKIYNRGKATAKNVKVSFPDDPNIIIREFPSSFDISPQNSMDISVSIFVGSPSTIKIAIEWEDGIRFNNKDTRIMQLR